MVTVPWRVCLEKYRTYIIVRVETFSPKQLGWHHLRQWHSWTFGQTIVVTTQSLKNGKIIVIVAPQV